MRKLLAIAVVGLTGCSKILGINDVKLGDAGGDGTTTPDAPPNTVIGKSFLRCQQVSGVPTVDLFTDLTTSIIAALIPDGSPSGYTVKPGTGSADGTFIIHDVPDGVEYVLKMGRNYWVTSAHVIDDHGEEPLRCDPTTTPTTAPTNVTFALTNMTSYADDESGRPLSIIDTIELDSYGLSYQANLAAASRATTLDQVFDWKRGQSYVSPTRPLLDQSVGDDFEVLHLRTEGLRDSSRRVARATHLVDVATPTGLTLRDGMPAMVAGAFSPSLANKTLSVSVNRGQFDVGFDGYSTFSSLNVSILAHPILTDIGVGAVLAGFDFVDWTRAPTLSQTINNYSYSDPFPATWKRFQQIDYQRTRRYLLPGTINPGFTNGSLYRLQEYTGSLGTTPAILPPTSIKIGGGDFGAGGKITFDGVAPVTVSWNAVAIAKSYTLTIYRVAPNGTGSTRTYVASIVTAGTAVKIPAEALTGGEFFIFSLNAGSGPPDYAAGHLILNGIPAQQALAPSGLFRLSATCGDGVVQAGEDCDTRGESATCDVDCSTPKCGDGLRNAAAGEACDTIDDTSTCNASATGALACKPAMCGDGYANAAAGEDCDLGANNGTLGCSATCKFTGVCGNSIVEAGEECDGGSANTAMCNADCTLSRCPDGFLNTVAGEACDDGNSNDADGCNHSCKLVP